MHVCLWKVAAKIKQKKNPHHSVVRRSILDETFFSPFFVLFRWMLSYLQRHRRRYTLNNLLGEPFGALCCSTPFITCFATHRIGSNAPPAKDKVRLLVLIKWCYLYWSCDSCVQIAVHAHAHAHARYHTIVDWKEFRNSRRPTSASFTFSAQTFAESKESETRTFQLSSSFRFEDSTPVNTSPSPFHRPTYRSEGMYFSLRTAHCAHRHFNQCSSAFRMATAIHNTHDATVRFGRQWMCSWNAQSDSNSNVFGP